MKEIEIQLIAKADKAIEEVEALKNEIEETRKTVDKLSKNTDKKLGSISKATNALKKGFGAAGVAVKGFFLALGAKAFEKFMEVAMQNQVIVDALGVAFGTISSVVNQVVNAFTNAYKAVQEATGGFDALGKVLKNVVLIPVNLIKTEFFAIQKALLTAQAAWEMSFLGGKDPEKLAELNEKLEEVDANLKNAAGSLIGNFKNIGEGFGEAIEEVKTFGAAAIENIKEIDVAQTLSNQQRIQQLRNEAQIAIAENDKLQFQYQLAAERQRQIRDDVTASIEDRTAANNKLAEVLQEQFKLQEANALKQLELAQLEAQEFPKSVERKVALIEAEKNLADVRENIAGFESEQRVNAEALELEAIELINSKSEAENARLIAKKQFNAEEIDDERLKLETLKAIAQEELRIEEERLQAQINRLAVGTQARQDAEQELLNFQQEKNLQIQGLSNQIADQEEKDNQTRIQSDQAVFQSKLAAASQAIGALSALAEEGSAEYKALAVGQAVIDAYSAIQATLAAASANPASVLFPGYPFVQSAIIGATAFANVRKILSTNPSSPSGGAAPSRGSTPAAPAFNVVGASPTNQLATALGEQQKQPVKAYVVSDDVSNAQALDRKIIKGASIG